MRSFIGVGLIGCLLFVAVESSARQRAGTCREPECGRTETDQTNQGSNRQQDNKPPATSDKKDQSPCGKNPPDKGFVYYKDRSSERAIHAEPSADSESVGKPPNGIRLMYDQVIESGGRRWYHVRQPSGPPGWLPSYDVSCERPTNPPPPKPDRVMDCDIPLAEPSSAQGGSRSFAAGSPCEEYQRQHGPVSFR
jgi:hypothetical protein